MKVLLIGKFSFDPSIYTYPSSFISAFEANGAEVITFNTVNGTRIGSILTHFNASKILSRLLPSCIKHWLLNKQLLQSVKQIKPDLIFIIKGNQILPSTLQIIKQKYPTIKILHFYADNPFCFWNGNANSHVLNGLPYIDQFLIWSKELIPIIQSAGCKKVSYFPFAFDDRIYHPNTTLDFFQNSEELMDPGSKSGMTGGKYRQSLSSQPPSWDPVLYFTSDVVFVGTWDTEREAFLLQLVQALPTLNLAIWGNRWNEFLPSNSPLKKYLRGKAIYKESLLKAFAGSKIVLNFIRPQNLQAHNMRTFEALATGSFLLTQKTVEQSQDPFIEDFNIACFNDAEDLIKKIAFYVNHDSLRKEIAKKGLMLAQEFTLHKQIQSLLATLEAKSSNDG
ncbi:glycosyltransferase [Candidatus Dependentiae bacterium]|nr:glycosyltransferase [Candidatus Dependentiae bacterium]